MAACLCHEFSLSLAWICIRSLAWKSDKFIAEKLVRSVPDITLPLMMDMTNQISPFSSPVVALRVAEVEDLHVLGGQLTEVLELPGLRPRAGAVGLLDHVQKRPLQNV